MQFHNLVNAAIQDTLDRGRVDSDYFGRKFPAARQVWPSILRQAKRDPRVRVVGKSLVRVAMRFDGRKHVNTPETVLQLSKQEKALQLLLLQLHPSQLQALLGEKSLAPFETIINSRRNMK